jgi:sugar phosphate isomerase/epimerase
MLPQLQQRGVEGLVIAPTMVWDGAPEVSESDALNFRSRVEDEGLKIVGMQSLTFKLENAALSGDPEARRRLEEHLKRQSELAKHLGATSLIFGSPGMRQAGVDHDQAVEVFAAVSQTAADNGNKICIEPLSGYGVKLVATTTQGVQFVEKVRQAGNPNGVGLHLDSAAIAGQERPRAGLDIIAARAITGIESFDASAPNLLSLSGDTTVDHRAMGDALRVAGYTGYISLEMRAPNGEDPEDAFLCEVDLVRERYGLGR